MDRTQEDEHSDELERIKYCRSGRRPSISAESYDPELNDSLEINEVFPKTDEQRHQLYTVTSEMLLFRCLEPEQLQEVIDAMFEKEVATGETIIAQGDDGDFFYVIESGEYEVTVSSQTGDILTTKRMTSGHFGEIALMYNIPRSATVKAISGGVLWTMSRDSFRKIVLMSAFRKIRAYENLLDSVPMLQSLDHYEKTNLAHALVSKNFKPGSTIVRKGEKADGMFFVENGEVRVTITIGGVEVEVSRLFKGQYFGEMALLQNSRRTANVYAVSEVKVAFLERNSFERLLGSCMDIIKRGTENYQISK